MGKQAQHLCIRVSVGRTASDQCSLPLMQQHLSPVLGRFYDEIQGDPRQENSRVMASFI